MQKRHRLGHNDYVNLLKDRIAGQYKEVRTFDEYHFHNDGEIDLMGISPGIIDIYEVKCNNGKDKAIIQLMRAKRNFGHNGKKIRLFYYCGKDNHLEEIQ